MSLYSIWWAEEQGYRIYTGPYKEERPGAAAFGATALVDMTAPMVNAYDLLPLLPDGCTYLRTAQDPEGHLCRAE